jgi:hypothetical protein
VPSSGAFYNQHYLIKRQYKLNGTQQIHINNDRISLPVNSLVNEPNGQLELAKTDISGIDIVYWVQTNKGVTTRTIYETHICLVSGKSLKLDVLHYPLKHMFYLMVYFDYPVKIIQRHCSAKYIFKILLLAFPVVAHFALTILMVVLMTPLTI